LLEIEYQGMIVIAAHFSGINGYCRTTEYLGERQQGKFAHLGIAPRQSFLVGEKQG